MLFNSYDFMLFFPVVTIIYFVIPRKIRYIFLLISSYFFYMGWNPRYALLIAISTGVTYSSGMMLDFVNGSENQERERQKKKKVIVAISFISNMGILAFFKYYDFFLQNLNIVLYKIGAEILEKPFDILLPVGISFYTFQALGYTMDVYRGDIKAERNFLRYALFVSFFPQLVAGPIERSGNLLRQLRNIENIKVWNYERVTGGALLMLWGFFQKMVIADRVSIVVDQIYDSYWMYGSIELIFATLLFAVQIYCDFGSYSLIAMGAARIMGFELMENFQAPYFSRSVKEFWRRWHISLSTWFRDYLYIPLGGSRCSRIKKYRNTIFTFLISGLWHGASWNYIVWGGIHGAYQVVGDATKTWRDRLYQKMNVKTQSFSYKLGKTLLTFVLVDFAWIFFRMSSLKHSLLFIERIFTKWDPWVFFDETLYLLGLNYRDMHVLLVALAILFAVDFIHFRYSMTLEKFLREQCTWFRWSVIFILLFFIVIYGVYGPAFDQKQFIYFQF